MIRLHYYPGNASMTPHILLRELGVPFELVLVDRAVNAHKSAPYLRLNPNGLIPVLEEPGLCLYETGAVLLHLLDTHPEAGLIPDLGTPERAHFYKWLMWMTNTVQATLITYFYPERSVDAGNEDGARQVRAHAQARVASMLGQIDDQLAASGGPWFFGERYGGLDPFVFMLCRWTRGFSGPHGPARDLPHVGPFLKRMLERPAVREAIDAERLAAPLV